MEKCYGCGARSAPVQKIVDGKIVTVDEHPILGVLNKADLDTKSRPTTLANPNTASAFVGVAVCKACHEDPAHRIAHALKCHFFERGGKQSMVGMILAGSNDLG